jgi:hypothetical protein
VTLNSGYGTSEFSVDQSPEEVIAAIDAARVPVDPSVFGGPSPAVTPDELQRQEAIAEALGRGMAKGHKKGTDEADRETWGAP